MFQFIKKNGEYNTKHWDLKENRCVDDVFEVVNHSNYMGEGRKCKNFTEFLNKFIWIIGKILIKMSV